MGSSSGPTSTVTSQPPPWYSDAARGYLQRAGEVAGQDYQPYTGQRVADLSDTTLAGIRGIYDMAQGHPMGNDAVDMTRRTLQGGYSNPFAGQGGANVSTQRNQFAGMQNPNGNVSAQRNSYGGMENPAFRSMLTSGLEDISKAYKEGTSADTTRMFNLSGAFGGSAHQNTVKNNEEALAKQMGQFSSGMLNDQFNRSSGLEESFLGRDFAGQQFNAGLGENAINRLMGSEESFLGRDFAGQQFNSGLGEAAANRGFQGHENERGRQMQGVGAATNLLDTHSRNLMNAVQAGGVERNQMQDLLNSQYGDFNEWRNYPNQQLDVFGNALSRSAGGAGSTQTQQGPGPDRVSQGMGALALGNYLGRDK